MKEEQNQDEVAEYGFDDLKGMTVGIAVVALTAAFVLGAMVETRDDFTALSHEYNATDKGILALEKIPAKLGMLITIFLIVIIIGALYLLSSRS